MLAFGGKDGIIDIYDKATQKKTKYFKAHQSAVTDIMFTSDESQIVTLGADKCLKIFSVEDPKKTFRSKDRCHGFGVPNTICFHENEKYIVSGGEDNCVKLWTF